MVARGDDEEPDGVLVGVLGLWIDGVGAGPELRDGVLVRILFPESAQEAVQARWRVGAGEQEQLRGAPAIIARGTPAQGDRLGIALEPAGGHPLELGCSQEGTGIQAFRRRLTTDRGGRRRHGPSQQDCTGDIDCWATAPHATDLPV